MENRILIVGPCEVINEILWLRTRILYHQDLVPIGTGAHPIIKVLDKMHHQEIQVLRAMVRRHTLVISHLSIV